MDKFKSFSFLYSYIKYTHENRVASCMTLTINSYNEITNMDEKCEFDKL